MIRQASYVNADFPDGDEFAKYMLTVDTMDGIASITVNAPTRINPVRRS